MGSGDGLDVEPNRGVPADAATAAKWAGVVGVLMLLGALALYTALSRRAEPPPPDVAADPLLRQGREVYLSRCVGCHGPKGKGDGPLAKGLSGPPVGDLSDDRWKHGGTPDEVLAVVREGVRDASMPGWGKVLEPGDVTAVTAYVFHLAGREVPAPFRKP